MTEKTIVGLTEPVILRNNGMEKYAEARIDTGARLSSVDVRIASELALGPVIKIKKVKSANGQVVRPVVIAKVEIMGKEYEGNFTLADRGHMNYPILIGQDILTQGFLIDPEKYAEEK